MTTASRLREAHERQLVRKGASPGNLGWVVTEKAYVSKTDRGVLETRLIGPGRYQHTWTDTDGAVLQPSDRWWDWRDDAAYRKAHKHLSGNKS